MLVFTIARAIYDAISSSLPRTDTDGAKRTDASIVISNEDAVTGEARGSMRNMDIYIEAQKVSLVIWDGTDGRSVSAAVSIKSKPW